MLVWCDTGNKQKEIDSVFSKIIKHSAHSYGWMDNKATTENDFDRDLFGFRDDNESKYDEKNIFEFFEHNLVSGNF